MKKLKPYHVTDNTVEMKAVFGLTSSTKHKKTKHENFSDGFQHNIGFQFSAFQGPVSNALENARDRTTIVPA